MLESFMTVVIQQSHHFHVPLQPLRSYHVCYLKNRQSDPHLEAENVMLYSPLPYWGLVGNIGTSYLEFYRDCIPLLLLLRSKLPHSVRSCYPHPKLACI